VSLAIRAATVGDEPAVLDLLEVLFEPPGVRPPGYARERAAVAFRHAVESDDADVLLGLDGDAVVGLASVYVLFPSMRFGRRCWLEDLVVRPAQRSKGVGRQLLDAATSWGQARGCPLLELTSAAARTDAHRFYRANGMVQAFVFDRIIPRRR
jgi:GNAT superfamily N-acetyltransferase